MAEFDARTALDSLPDAVVIADRSQTILQANRGVERLLGWKPEGLAGRPLSDLIPPPHREAMELGRPILVRAARPDGTTEPVEMLLAGDSDTLLSVTLRPVGEGDSARKLRAILETISVGVLLAEGPAGKLTVSNTAADAIAGEPIRADSYAEFVAKFPLERLDGHLMELNERPLFRTIESGGPVREVLKYRRKDGREAILEVTTAPFPGAAGGAVTTFLDVTERYELEQDLAQRAAELRALLDHLPVGVAYFDKMGVCRAGNSPARRFLGRPRNEIIGLPASELFAQSPDLRDDLLRCIGQHASVVRPRVPWPDAGRPVPSRFLDWQFEPLSPDPARPRGALAIIADVTERAQAEAEKQRAMEAAESASRRKTQFLSAVSHDLRTPVNALSLQAELLSRLLEIRKEPDEELQLLSGDIRAAANNLIELINDLLDLSRFDSGAFDYRPSDFALDEWLESTLAPLELTARTKGLEFLWKTDRPGRIIHADRVKLGRVLTNLVGNAVKFTERGEVAITVSADPLGRLVLEVRDTGPGIPANQLERIFDEFAQLRNPERDRTKGTGLGLAICRRLVEGVGGELNVASEHGRGSTFTAIYPPDHLPKTAEGDSSSHFVIFPPSEPNEAREAATILVVEDDEASRQAMMRLLQHLGYRVRVAASGLEAMATIRGETPDLILLDLVLPGMDGGEVLRRIRRDPERKSVKIVVIAGDVMEAETNEFQMINADGMLGKPVDLNALSSLLAELLPLRRPTE